MPSIARSADIERQLLAPLEALLRDAQALLGVELDADRLEEAAGRGWSESAALPFPALNRTEPARRAIARPPAEQSRDHLLRVSPAPRCAALSIRYSPVRRLSSKENSRREWSIAPSRAACRQVPYRRRCREPASSRLFSSLPRPRNPSRPRSGLIARRVLPARAPTSTALLPLLQPPCSARRIIPCLRSARRCRISSGRVAHPTWRTSGNASSQDAVRRWPPDARR